MRLATIRTPDGTRTARVDPTTGDATLLAGASLREVLDQPDWRRAAADADGPTLSAANVSYAPVVPDPDKIICVGVNYRAHIEEMGRDIPAHPTYFAKYRRALIGAHDPIRLPDTGVSTSIDWEGELAIIIGRPVRNASPLEAAEAIAGFCVLNDVSARDWQRRTIQFLAGKTFESMTPVGPWLTTVDEVGVSPELDLLTEVDGVAKQSANTSDLVFGPVDIVQDLSRIITLDPGDIIATGTPSGVGFAREPQEFLRPGSTVSVTIDALGSVRNKCEAS